tara:strand:+ start:233 stop:514 length:282 start_codon:yes stop_codon:yes gene_type:complete
MPSYKLTKDSDKKENGHIRAMVTLIRDDGTESVEQFVEKRTDDEVEFYKMLDAMAQGWEDLRGSSDNSNSLTSLVTGTVLKQGVKVSELEALK